MPERFLLMTSQVSGLGDVILASPFLRALRQAHPKAHLSLFTGPAGAAAAEAYRARYGRLYVDDPALRAALVSEWKRERFDATFCLSEAFSSILLARRSGAARTCGFNWNGRGLALKAAVRYHKPERRHILDYYGELAAAAGIGGYVPETDFPIGPRERDAAGDWLRERAGGAAVPPFVAIHPGAGEPTKRWPPERYLEIARRLAEEKKIAVALVGGPAEQAIAGHIPGHPLLWNAIGRFTLRETAAVLDAARLVVGNDGGLLQLAAALKKPMTALYRSRDLKTVPRHPGASVIRAERGGRPSNAIARIPVEAVWDSVQAHLESA